MLDELDEGESGMLASFPRNMRQFIRDYKRDNPIYDKDAYYLFVIKDAPSGRAGFMPFKRQFGFVFSNKTPNLERTIAHELGHGAFRLRHTFSSKDFIANQGETDNLMDYSQGNHLHKQQWDYIHHPQDVIGWFEDDEEGESYDPSFEDIWAANLLNMICAKSRGQDLVDINVNYHVNQSTITYGNRGRVKFEINDIEIVIEVDKLPDIGQYKLDLNSKKSSISDGKYFLSYNLSNTEKKLIFSVNYSNSSTFSNWFTSPPTSIFQLMVDKIPTYEGNATYSSLSRLPECAFELITAPNRIKYIDWMINREWITNKYQEELIIRILEEVHDDQVLGLVSELESYKDWEGLFESFDNISTHQGLFRAIMALYSASTTKEEQENIEAVFDFNMLNHTSNLLDYISVIDVEYEDRQLKFTRELSTASWVPNLGLQNVQRSTKVHAQVDLFEPVLVIVNDDHENLGLQPGTELRSIPAILAAFFIEKKDSEDNKQLASTGLDVALLAAGIGEISAAIRVYKAARTIRSLFRLTLAVSDFAVSYTDIACQSDNSELCKEWREVSFYIQIGLLSVNAADGIESLIKRTDNLALNSIDDIFDANSLRSMDGVTPTGNKHLVNLRFEVFKKFLSKKYIESLDGGAYTSGLAKIMNGSDGTGELTEKIVEAAMRNKGYTVTTDIGKYGSNNGFDVVAYKGSLDNPSEIIIIECKQFKQNKVLSEFDDVANASGYDAASGLRLNTANPTTGLPTQMSSDWTFNHVAEKLLNSDVDDKVELGVQVSTNRDIVSKFVFAIDKSDGAGYFTKLE